MVPLYNRDVRRVGCFENNAEPTATDTRSCPIPTRNQLLVGLRFRGMAGWLRCCHS